MDQLKALLREDAVRRRRIDGRGPALLEELGGQRQGAAGRDHVVDDHGRLAATSPTISSASDTSGPGCRFEMIASDPPVRPRSSSARATPPASGLTTTRSGRPCRLI